MLRILIVDDERLARSALRRLLAVETDIEMIVEAESIKEAVIKIEENKPNLVFMDIELRNSNGFEIFDKLTNLPAIVFVTAYSEHAVRAFSVNAIDYLLKPVSRSRLEESLNRTRKKIFSKQQDQSSKSFTIELKTPTRSVILPTNDIVALKAEGDFSHVMFIDQPPLMICRTLTSLEQSLSEPNFLRIGRSIIVNTNHVLKVNANKNSKYLIHIDGIKEPLEIGATSAARLRKALFEL